MTVETPPVVWITYKTRFRSKLHISNMSQMNSDILSASGPTDDATSYWHFGICCTAVAYQVCEIGSPPLSILGHTIFSVILCLLLSLHGAILAAWSLFSHLLLFFNSLPSSVVSCSSKSAFTRAPDRPFSSDKFSFVTVICFLCNRYLLSIPALSSKERLHSSLVLIGNPWVELSPASGIELERATGWR